MRLTLGYFLLLGGVLLTLGAVVYWTLPSGLLRMVMDHAGWYLVAVGLLLIILSSFLVQQISRGITGPLAKINETVDQLLRGNWGVYIKQAPDDELGEAVSALNSLSQQVRETIQALEISNGRLAAILEHMSSGVVFVDRSGRVILLNSAARDILRVQDDALRKSQVEVIQNYSLSKLISDVLENWEPQRQEISLFYPEERIMDVTVGPVVGENKERRGVVVVLHDITEIKRLERMRSDFVANVSHELKTPVTSIKGFAETLLEGALYNHRAAEEFVHIINEESERLARLVNDILEIYKIEFKEIRPRRISLELTKEIKEIVDHIQPRFRRAGLSLEVELPKDPVFVQADPDLTRLVLENLLDNSLNYTPEGGRVTVKLLPGSDQVVTVIEDTGIGIPKEDLPRIFERFYRVDKARSRKSGGTGLGLAIVKHAVTAQGGRVWAESEPDKGSRFYFSLPAE